MSSTMTYSKAGRVVTQNEVRPKGIWSRRRKATAVLAILLPLGWSLLTAPSGPAPLAIGIVALALATASGVLVLAARGSSGRHRA